QDPRVRVVGDVHDEGVVQRIPAALLDGFAVHYQQVPPGHRYRRVAADLATQVTEAQPAHQLGPMGVGDVQHDEAEASVRQVGPVTGHVGRSVQVRLGEPPV